MARRTVRSRRNPAELEPIVQLWILRILMKTPAHTRFVRRDCFNDDTLAERLRLEQWVDVADEEFEPTRIRAELRSMLREAEQRAPFEPIGSQEQLRADAQKLHKNLCSFERRFSLENKIRFGPRKPTEIADLSVDESTSLRSLNDSLDEAGQHIEALFANIGEQMDQPIADPTNRMTDYEMQAEVRFHLHDGDPGVPRLQ